MTELIKALVKVQGELKSVPFDSKNPHYKSQYASLAAFQEAVRPALAKNDLVVVQEPGFDPENNHHTLSTRLLHSSGQELKSTMYLELTKKDMQGLGSAVTYAKRYALSALLNVSGAEDDDDATQAVQHGHKPAVISQEPPKMSREEQNELDAFLDKDPHPMPPGKFPQKAPTEPGAFIVPFGKWRGKRLDEVGVHEARKTIDYFDQANKKSGLPESGPLKHFRKMVHAYAMSVIEPEPEIPF